jgi:phosphodiesterase/alkaline phosphatase D-like protein
MRLAIAVSFVLAFAVPAMAQPVIIPVDDPGGPGPSPTPLPPPTGDTTAPATTSSLAVLSTTMTSATIQWTAPGDDGTTGTAAQYDVRYSTAGPITLSTWSSAIAVVGEPAPAAAGTVQSMTVTGLSPGTTYWFALRTADEVPNWSGVSNSPSGTTLTAPDTTAPAAVTDLAVTGAGVTTTTLSWTAPGDDGMTGTATAYDVRVSASPITTDVEFQAASPVTSGVPAPAAAGTVQNAQVTGLAQGTTYWFAIKTRDEVNNWSGLSNTASGTTGVPKPADGRTHKACGGSAAAGGSLAGLSLMAALLAALAVRR